MTKRFIALSFLLTLFPAFLLSRPVSAASKGGETAGPSPKILAVETFLADIAQNVAGNRLKVEALLPVGADPHSFEPTPGDVRKVADSTVLIVNGAGIETFLERLLRNAGGKRLIIEASTGLPFRKIAEDEAVEVHESKAAGKEEHHHMKGEHHHEEGGHHHHEEGDPHFWLAPANVLTYVQNIRKGLSEADPDGAALYAANADAYAVQLKELDRWIADRTREIPPERRLLVTNHESFGYFADRYGFRIVGTIVPSVSTEAAPSARQLAELVDSIRAAGARAIFLETGTNPQLARQVGLETGIKVVTNLYTHSVTTPDGPAPTYIDMMKANTLAIVDALK